MLMAVALASGSFVLAGILSSSADRQLVDKASLYIGSDLAINLIGSAEAPAAIADRATVVRRLDTTLDGDPVDVLGIDLETFARAVNWRDDAASRPLAELLDEIRWHGEGAIPAVLVADDAPDIGSTLVVETGANRSEVVAAGRRRCRVLPRVQAGHDAGRGRSVGVGRRRTGGGHLDLGA